MTDVELNICRELEKASAEELLAFYQYQIVVPYIFGSGSAAVADFFHDTGEDELQDHFMKLINRMGALGYVPRTLMDFAGVQSLAGCPYSIPGSMSDLQALLEQNIAAEECAIHHYEQILSLCEDVDAETYSMIEGILSDEREHLAGLQGLLSEIG